MAKQQVVEGLTVNLDPKVILADDNTRFNLKQSRIESLADSILAQGGIIEPVEVEPMEHANGHTHRLTLGFYRLAAINHLNSQGAGLTIPATIRNAATPTDRLKRQLAENMERENQSPMDQAIAIRRLLDAGLSKVEVRAIFSRPGGRKGSKVQPASNAWLNMTLGFLDLPKNIQTKIHEGLVGVATAYQLTKIAPEKRNEVLAAAEAERDARIAKEEREEQRLLEHEKKTAAAAEKRNKLLEVSTLAEGELTKATESLEEKVVAATEAYKASKLKHESVTAKKAAEAAFKTAEANRKVAEAQAEQAQKDFEKAHQAFTKAETGAAEKAAALEGNKAKAPAVAKKGKAVSSGDVQKAAKETGNAAAGSVPLTLAEVRKSVIFLTEADSNSLRGIGRALQQHYAGVTTEKQFKKELEAAVKL